MLGRKEQNQTLIGCAGLGTASLFRVLAWSLNELTVSNGAGKPLNGRIHEWGDFCYRYEKEYSQRPGKSRAVTVTFQGREETDRLARAMSLGNRGKGTGRCRTVSMCVCVCVCVYACAHPVNWNDLED